MAFVSRQILCLSMTGSCHIHKLAQAKKLKTREAMPLNPSTIAKLKHPIKRCSS